MEFLDDWQTGWMNGRLLGINGNLSFFNIHCIEYFLNQKLARVLSA
jgi:hypothetical protein